MIVISTETILDIFFAGMSLFLCSVGSALIFFRMDKQDAIAGIVCIIFGVVFAFIGLNMNYSWIIMK